MTTKRKSEMVEILTREGDLALAAGFAAMTDEEFAACTARAQKIADIFIKDPLMWLELENELDERGEGRPDDH
jgi:hypothetical protein